MTSQSTLAQRLSAPSRRTAVVWVSFGLAMTVVTGLLLLDGGVSRSGFLVAASVGPISHTDEIDPIFQLEAPVDRDRWTGIVIHHLGQPAGDAASIDREHTSMGLQGLGYHFVIGNGNGLGDGIIHVGYRWNEQLPGAHAVGENADEHNLHSIGICLVGNGNRRPFTEAQIAHLISLVQRLQRELHIPADRVLLQDDLDPTRRSPGRLFDRARLYDQLLPIRQPA